MTCFLDYGLWVLGARKRELSLRGTWPSVIARPFVMQYKYLLQAALNWERSPQPSAITCRRSRPSRVESPVNSLQLATQRRGLCFHESSLSPPPIPSTGVRSQVLRFCSSSLASRAPQDQLSPNVHIAEFRSCSLKTTPRVGLREAAMAKNDEQHQACAVSRQRRPCCHISLSLLTVCGTRRPASKATRSTANRRVRWES